MSEIVAKLTPEQSEKFKRAQNHSTMLRAQLAEYALKQHQIGNQITSLEMSLQTIVRDVREHFNIPPEVALVASMTEEGEIVLTEPQQE